MGRVQAVFWTLVVVGVIVAAIVAHNAAGREDKNKVLMATILLGVFGPALLYGMAMGRGLQTKVSLLVVGIASGIFIGVFAGANSDSTQAPTTSIAN
jgi:hypothetical protein